MSQRRSMVDTKKSLQTTLSVFLTDLEELSGVYLKITTNIYLLCSGSFEDLFLNPLDFEVALDPGWDGTFVVKGFLGWAWKT